MLRERTAGFFTQTVDEVPDALRQTGLLGDFHKQLGGQWRKFGGLVDDRAAGRESGRDLPGRQHERRIPRRDDADRTDWISDRHSDLRRPLQRTAVAGLRRAIGEESKVFRTAKGRLRHKFERLARVHALDEGDLFGTGNDGVRNLMQQRLSLLTVKIRPAVEGSLCRADAITARSTGDIVSNVSPSIAARLVPSM